MEILTKSAGETAELGEKLAADLKSGTVIALYGDLGSGKTTFIQGLAKGLGITQRILSPTFVLMREYDINESKHETRNTKNEFRFAYHVSRFYHIDLYRITTEQDTESLGLQEIWSDPTNVVAIEWPDRISSLLPKIRIDIYFKYLDNEKRVIKLNIKNQKLK